MLRDPQADHSHEVTSTSHPHAVAPPTWRRVLDDVLDATGTGQRTLLAGVLAIGVLVGAGWWLTRQTPVPVESTLPVIDVAAITTTTEPAGPVVVHVAGAVVRPGVHRLPAGSRVIDAVEASGGLAPDADAARVNLAAVVADAAQIYVPRLGEAAPPAGAGAGAASGPGDGLVDLNTADLAALDALPGIGPATAAAIVAHRDEHGPFATVEDLLEVRGIGEAKLEALRDLVRV